MEQTFRPMPSNQSRLRSLLWITVLVVSATACAGATAPAQESDTPAATPERTERLAVEVPQGWRQLLDRRVGALYLADYYPTTDIEKLINASAEDASAVWSDKLSVEILASSEPPDPLMVVQSMAESQFDACEHPSDQGIFAGFENGYPTAVHILQCPSARATGRGLLTLVKVIQGKQALYTLSRIWRVQATDIAPADPEGEPQPAPEVAVDPGAVAAWADTFKRFKLCDPSAAQHPCE